MEKDNKYSQVALRLKVVREDELKWTQQEIAEKCGVSREMWGKYERGLSMPGSDVFLWLALEGIDIFWVLTGQEHPKSMILDADEKALVTAYRKASSVEKEFISQACNMAAKVTAKTTKAPKVKQTVRGSGPTIQVGASVTGGAVKIKTARES